MQRRAIEVRGIVQSVGLRPYIYGVATRLGLGGFVQNRTGTVRIEVEGESGSLDLFCEQLTEHPPVLAQIESVSWQYLAPIGEYRFSIRPSDSSEKKHVFISPDIATCRDCLAELFDPLNRRYRYPFINCTNCGPRLTIVTGTPYDRHFTTMAGFDMCPRCRGEFEDPTNRRFHAVPIACAECGPRLSLCHSDGTMIATADPLAEFAEAIRTGKIGAMKGLGGFHLICDAGNEHAVSELRSRKHRDEKPLAIMVRDVASAEWICHLGPDERKLLGSPQAPIVLLSRRSDPCESSVASNVAPGNPYLGIMLPYTPLHHLLMAEIYPTPLVMTSGNTSDDPITYEDSDAFLRLGSIADVFLIHDRPIQIRCDDSVTRILHGNPSPVRRSRGFAPEPIRLPWELPTSILAVGGQQKSTFAIGSQSHAVISHHLGDLDYVDAYRAFERDVDLYKTLFSIEPALIAHDLHPDYASTRYALARGLPCIPIQHHHAHMASCMAEHGLNEPVIGITFDGAGLGSDGAIWGGEFLIGDYCGFQRIAHLRYVPMPGGEKATREPWRMAAAHLRDANLDTELLNRFTTPSAQQVIRSMIQQKYNSPLTSSMGRLFDAVAAIAGIRGTVSYEGQAAAQLEWLAKQTSFSDPYSFGVDETQNSDRAPGWVIDTRPLIRDVAEDRLRGTAAATIAQRFHSTIVELIVELCMRTQQRHGLRKVVLSGGVFMNAILTSESYSRLSAAGFSVYFHQRVPTNDGGLSLGQIAIASRNMTDFVD